MHFTFILKLKQLTMKKILTIVLLLLVQKGFSQLIYGTRNNAGDWAGSTSGFFETAAPVNYPAGASGWWHLIDMRHGNPNFNMRMQFAGSFYDQKLFFYSA